MAGRRVTVKISEGAVANRHNSARGGLPVKNAPEERLAGRNCVLSLHFKLVSIQ